MRVYLWMAGAFALLLVAWVAYAWAYGNGSDDGYGKCVAEYQPKIGALINEKLAAQRAVIAAQRAKAEAEEVLAAQLEDQAHDYTKRIASLEAGNAGARRELQRLRDALATARAGIRALAKPQAAGAGPSADGGPADAGELLGQCGARLVEMGGHADRLAAQVIGLQAYARIAHKACGS